MAGFMLPPWLTGGGAPNMVGKTDLGALTRLDSGVPEDPYAAIRPADYKPGIGGVFQRLGEQLKQPGMAGAFLRGAAASFNGDGLGGSINAITDTMDKRRREKIALDQQGIENSQRGRGLDIQEKGVDHNYDLGVMRDGTDRRGQDFNFTLGGMRDKTDRRGQDLGFQTAAMRDRTDRRGQDMGWSTAAENRNFQRSEGALDRTFKREEGAADRGSRERVWTGRNQTSLMNTHTRAASGGGGPSKAELDIPAVPAGASPDDLDVGQVYRTPKGIMQWDGSGFIPVR